MKSTSCSCPTKGRFGAPSSGSCLWVDWEWHINGTDADIGGLIMEIILCALNYQTNLVLICSTILFRWLLYLISFQAVQLSQAYYDDVVDERSISKLCGYPSCPNKLTQVNNRNNNNKMVIIASVYSATCYRLQILPQKYKISLQKTKVYDITERKVCLQRTDYCMISFVIRLIESMQLHCLSVLWLHIEILLWSLLQSIAAHS